MTPRSMACETLARYGPTGAETASLLAILGIPGDLTLPEILSGSLMGLTQPVRDKCEALAEIMRRKGTESPRPRICSPRSAGEYLLPRAVGWTEERFGMIALNAKGELIGERIIAQGTATALLITPREFYRAAINLGACTALAYHNHPSGDPSPSREDTLLTKRLRNAGASLGMALADHIVLGGDRYHSFRAAEGWDSEL